MFRYILYNLKQTFALLWSYMFYFAQYWHYGGIIKQIMTKHSGDRDTILLTLRILMEGVWKNALSPVDSLRATGHFSDPPESLG